MVRRKDDEGTCSICRFPVIAQSWPWCSQIAVKKQQHSRGACDRL